MQDDGKRIAHMTEMLADQAATLQALRQGQASLNLMALQDKDTQIALLAERIVVLEAGPWEIVMSALRGGMIIAADGRSGCWWPQDTTWCVDIVTAETGAARRGYATAQDARAVVVAVLGEPVNMVTLAQTNMRLLHVESGR